MSLVKRSFSDFTTIVFVEYWIHLNKESMRKHGKIPHLPKCHLCFPFRVPCTHLLPSCSRASFTLRGHNVKRRNAPLPEGAAESVPSWPAAPSPCPPQQTSSDGRCLCVSDRGGMEGTGHQIESDQHPLRLPLQCAGAAADR